MSENKKTERVRFYSSKYKDLRLVVGDKRVKFINHEFVTSDPILIHHLDNAKGVDRYDIAMKKKSLALDKHAMKKLSEDVKAELREELTPVIREELEAKLREEIRAEIEAELSIEEDEK